LSPLLFENIANNEDVGVSVRVLFYLSLFSLMSCSQAYYGALEKIGIEKREILRDRIVSTQKSRKETAEDFKSALERFQDIAPFEGGELEEKYSRLSTTVDNLESRQAQVRDRIDSVENKA
jgi:hypothetical protein